MLMISPPQASLFAAAGGLPSVSGLLLHEHDAADPLRPDVEEFIRCVYGRHYGADVRQFAPVLVSLREPGDGTIRAAAGYRPAADGPLFLERYLDASVETLLARHGQALPARSAIVEIGHLASDHAGDGRRLILELAPHLAALGFDWVVSTLTRRLRLLFLRLGVAPLTLGAADPAALDQAATQWGSYYEHDPVIWAGDLRQALRCLPAAAGGRR